MIDNAERRWVWQFAGLVVMITTLPYLLGYFFQNPEWVYTGHLFGAEDGHSYVAQMLLGARGDWLFRSPYTEMPQRGAVVLLPYMLLGKLTAPPAQYEQMLALYHALRIAGTVGCVWATYALLSVVIHRRVMRRFAVVLAIGGGGPGILRLLNGQTTLPPLEFYSPEAFGYLMILGIPHLAAARALLLWGVKEFLAPRPDTWTGKGWIAAGLPWLGAALFQPLPVIAGWGAVSMYLLLWGAWMIWQQHYGSPSDWGAWRMSLLRAVRIGIVTAPVVFYTTVIFRLDPALRIWEAQNRLFTPEIWEYLLSYSLILPFAAWGTLQLMREKQPQLFLFAGWVLGGMLWIYLPITVQRRLIEGAWVALVALAVAGLERMPATRARWGTGLLSLSFFVPLIFLAGMLIAVTRPALPLYRPAGEVALFQYLAAQMEKDKVVLANPTISTALPAWAPARVLLGHGPLALDGPQKAQDVVALLSGEMPEAERERFLRESRVQFLVWGPQERLQSTWDPYSISYLQPQYEQNGYTLFRIEWGAGKDD